MGSPLSIALTGACGRMGRTLCTLIQEAEDLSLAAAFEHAGHAALGETIPPGVTVATLSAEALDGVDAVIDFSAPAGTLALAEAARSCPKAPVLVVGTTGFSPEELSRLEAYTEHLAILRAGNFSLGINLLMSLVQRAAAALGPDYDIEIVETHHRHKVDAPSGTALMLGEAAARGRGTDLTEVAQRGRDGITGTRPDGAIGFASLRGGAVIGDHTVLFAGASERIELTHKAEDRSLFARGALTAARWLAGKAPGAYSMADVVGEA